METVGKMIHVMEEERGPGLVSTVETGKSVLAIIGADQTPSPELKCYSHTTDLTV